MNFAENTHGGVLFDKLRLQQESGRFCDIVLYVEGRQFRAHRNVLAACSPYFDSVLRMHKTVLERLTVSCRNHAAFQSLLRYMYSGCVSIHWGNVAELLQLSNHFLIFKLKSHCAEYLERHLNLSNCLAVKELAERYSVPLLLKAVVSFVRENVDSVLDDPKLLQLSTDKFVAFVSDRRLGLPQGLPLLNLVTRWVSHDVEDREGRLRFLLTFVDWGALDPDGLRRCLSDTPLFARSLRCLYFFLETLDENGVPLLSQGSEEKRDRIRAQLSEVAGHCVDEESFMDLAVSTAIERLHSGMSEEARGSPEDAVKDNLDRDSEASADDPDCDEDLDTDSIQGNGKHN